MMDFTIYVLRRASKKALEAFVKEAYKAGVDWYREERRDMRVHDDGVGFQDSGCSSVENWPKDANEANGNAGTDDGEQ